MIIPFIIISLVLYYFFFRKEYYTSPENDPFILGMKDRFINNNRRYINQIDYYRDAPNINLEQAFNHPTINTDNIDWSKVSDIEYPKLVNYISGRDDAVRIKSINAL